MMRVLWPHNYSGVEPNAGVFMRTAAEAMRAQGVDPVMLDLGNLRSPRGFLRSRRALVRRARDFDLVHCQFGSAASLACTAIRDRALVMSIRGSDWTPAHATDWKWRVHARVAVALTRWAIPHFDVVIPVSQRIAGEIRSEFPDAAIVVAPDPIDTGQFRPLDRSQSRLRLGLSSVGHYAIFTSVDRDNPLKRRDLAESAVRVARQRFPSLEILIASGYSHDEMPSVISSADVAICTSVAEGWPNAIKEALACNVPFVATDVSDLALIAHQDPDCWVVPPEPQALADALVCVLQRPRPTDLRRHLKSMTMEEYARRTIAAYSMALDR